VRLRAGGAEGAQHNARGAGERAQDDEQLGTQRAFFFFTRCGRDLP
jgi:hypothetical protein